MFMWSATASESSIVIGPTSRRTRPRLSRRRVRSRGSSGSRDASRSTSTPASLFRARRPPERLRPCAAALPVEAALARTVRSVSSLRGGAALPVPRAASRRAARLRARGCAPGCARPARPRAAPGRRACTTRRFCVSVSALDASTSKSASTLVEDFCACCPPGPLDARHTQLDLRDGQQDGAS